MLGDVVLGILAGLGGVGVLFIFLYVLLELVHGRRRRSRERRERVAKLSRNIIDGRANGIELGGRDRRKLVQRELDRLRR